MPCPATLVLEPVEIMCWLGSVVQGAPRPAAVVLVTRAASAVPPELEQGGSTSDYAPVFGHFGCHCTSVTQTWIRTVSHTASTSFLNPLAHCRPCAWQHSTLIGCLEWVGWHGSQAGWQA
jgi:hypothetical protein